MGCADSTYTMPMGMSKRGSIGGPGMKMTLEYFDFCYGRADSIRFCLEKAGVKYQYIGHSNEEWGQMKANKPAHREFNFMPIWTVDGKEYGQSMALLRGIGTKHNMYFPQDPFTSYYCDVMLDCFVDVLDGCTGAILGVLLDPSKGGKPTAEDVNVLKEKWQKTCVPLFKLLVANMKAHGGKYAAGNRLTIADCVLVAGMDNIWCNAAGPFKATFDELFNSGDVDKAAIDSYFATLRSEFGARLNSRP